VACRRCHSDGAGIPLPSRPQRRLVRDDGPFDFGRGDEELVLDVDEVVRELDRLDVGAVACRRCHSDGAGIPLPSRPQRRQLRATHHGVPVTGRERTPSSEPEEGDVLVRVDPFVTEASKDRTLAATSWSASSAVSAAARVRSLLASVTKGSTRTSTSPSSLRALVDVGRADDGDAVVNDHRLGVDIGRFGRESSSVRLIMECQFRSICRGEGSIFARLRHEGIDPE
jgi:hypothetical protein